jgi:hypothetical protein
MVGISSSTSRSGGLVSQSQRLLEALLDDLGGQRARPAGVRRGQHQRPREAGMPAVQLKGKATAERQPDHVRPPQAERVDERG